MAGARRLNDLSASSTNSNTEYVPVLTRSEILGIQSRNLHRLLAARNQTFDKVVNYTDLYNAWYHMSDAHKEYSYIQRIRNTDGNLYWTVCLTTQWTSVGGSVKFSASIADPSKKIALNEVHKRILAQVMRIPRTQMDNTPSKESVQGDVTQESTKESNTIITRDQSETEETPVEKSQSTVIEVASSEPTFNFNQLVGRWMPLNSLNVKTNQPFDTVVATYNLPEDLLITHSKCAPNNIPFETFVYAQLDLEFKFVVNGNKFNTGKLIASLKFDNLLSKGRYETVQSALGRPHVILDMATNNQATLTIPFRFHRVFVRNYPHTTSSKGVRTAIFAQVIVNTLAPLTTGTGGPNNIDVRCFYRYKRADFAGMSYRVPLTQMDALAELALGAAPAPLKSILKEVENTICQFGKSNNQDKPTTNRMNIFVPRPRMHFGCGKGISDAVALKNNPFAQTSFREISPFVDDPKTTLDIARIWGLRTRSSWAASTAQGTELFDFALDPTMRSTKTDYKGSPTPLEFMCGMYNFWSGPIELRFDFISNSFHTGAVIISAEFNRTSTDTDQCESQSTYTKTFHLGEQKSVSFTVPYIFDTVWRRTSNQPYLPEGNDTTTPEIKYASLSVRPDVKTRIKMRVLNVLRPVAAAPQSIEILMFWRAGKNFNLHSPIQQAFRVDSDGDAHMDNFPLDGYPEIEEKLKPGSVKIKVLRPKRVPHVEMDNGEKENEDTTDDFNAGRSSYGVQTIDSQVSIKDILRRPVCMFTNVETDDESTGFFIPLMPPSFNWAKIKDPYTSAFNELMAETPQASLVNLFRFWRGSMRYTIVFTEAKYPAYVTYVPHSGVRMVGNVKVNTKTGVAHTRPLWGAGLITELVIPNINQTVCVEAPYDTENNWTYTWQTHMQQDLAWRDIGDTNAGHICISTPYEKVKMSVWWSAGDDFELGNFYGIPPVVSNTWAYSLDDEHGEATRHNGKYITPHTQMDFCTKKVPTAVSAFLKPMTNLMTPARAATTAMCAVPVVGPAFAAASLVSQASEATAGITSNLNRVTDRVESVATQVEISLQTLTALIQRTCDALLNGVEATASVGKLVFDLLLDLVVAWYDQSWFAVGVGIVRVLSKVVVGCISDALLEIGVKIGHYFKSLFTTEIPSTQAYTGEHNLTALIVAAVGTLVGARLDAGNIRQLPHSLLKRLTTSTGINYIFSMFKVVEIVFNTVKETVMYWLGYASPEAEAVKMLARDSPLIDKFVTEAQIIMSEANSALLMTPGFRARFWYTVLQAMQLQKLLIQVPNNIASPHLAKLCSEVIRLGNEKFVDISASPVRYEPFVVCIEGAPGIGKSDSTEKLVQILLEKIKLRRPHSGATYYRPPGNNFWSGYKDQPVVVYDDWMNLSDSERVVQQISELYTLKSTSIFIPNMAHLEEKRIRGNPLIVILLCNNAFPSSAVNQTVLEPDAVFRRRDVVLHARRKQEYLDTDLRTMTIEEQENIAHMELTRYERVEDRDSRGKVYRDFTTVANWLAQKFEVWHKQEIKKVKRRFDLIQAGMQSSNVEAMRMEDPFELYYSVAMRPEVALPSSSAAVPSDLLAAAVAQVVSALNAHQEETPQDEEPIRSTVEDIFQVIQQQDEASYFEDEVPRAQIHLGDVLNKVIWDPICRASKATLQAVIDRLDTWVCAREIQPRECPICHDIKVPYKACEQSIIAWQRGERGETIHSVCRSCFDGITAYDNQWNHDSRCPICRGNMVDFPRTEAKGIILVLIKAVQKGLLSIHGFLDKIQCWIGFKNYTSFKFLIDCIFFVYDGYDALSRQQPALFWWRLAPIVVGYNLISDTTPHYPINQDERVRGMTPRPQRVYTRVVTQVDDDPFGMSDQSDDEVEEPDPAIEIFVPRIRMDWLDFCTRYQEASTVPCLHEQLDRYSTTVRYSGGMFHIPHPVTPLSVPEEPCAGNCFLANPDRAERFFREHLEEKKHVYQALIASYYNEPTNRDYYKNKIPKAYRPDWMEREWPAYGEVQQFRAKNWVDYLSETWDNYKTVILVAGGISAVLAGMYKYFNMLQTPVEIQTPRNDGPFRQHLQTQHRQLTRPRPLRYAVPQSDLPTPTLDDVVKNYVLRNAMTVTVRRDGKVHRSMTITGLYNHVAIMPRHYLRVLREFKDTGYAIWIQPAMYNHEAKPYAWCDTDFKVCPNTDLCFFTLPSSFLLFKDIRKFFATDEDLTRPITNEGVLLLAPSPKNTLPNVIPLTIEGFQAQQLVEDNGGDKFTANDVLVYNYSQAGACGNVVLLTRTQRPICAMHFAGSGEGHRGEGYGVLLTQEAISHFVPSEGVVTQLEDVNLGSIEEAKIIFPEEVNVHYIGALAPTQVPFTPQKSKLRKSEIEGVHGLKTTVEQSILSKLDPRWEHPDTPLIAGAQKHGKLTLDFTTDELDAAEMALWDMFYSQMEPICVSPSRLDPVQACIGVPGLEYYEPMRLATSAGWPYSCSDRKQKADYIKIIHDEVGTPISAEIDPEVLRELDRRTHLRTLGIVPFTPFVDTLKDEKLKPAKARKYGGTRVFCNPPVDYVIAQRQNLLHFTTAFMAHRHKMQHAVGINVHGKEWTRLRNALARVSETNVIALDYSNFGPGFNAGVAARAANIMVRWTKKWVKDVCETELRALLYECTQSIHICHNTVYQQSSGSPSGAPITTVINSIVNQLYILLAWQHLYARPGGLKWEDYRQHVSLFVYGDDLIMSVSDDVVSFFNGETISNYFATHNIVATDSEKQRGVIAKKPLREATFLKHSFLPHPFRPGYYLAQVEYDTVWNVPLWIAETANRSEMTRANVQAALEQAHGLGPTKYRELQDKWNRALIKRKIQPVCIEWRELDDLFFTD